MNYNRVKDFWENQAKKQTTNVRCQTNFVTDEALQKLTIEKETAYIEKHLPLKETDVLFDIGAGAGFWSEYFSKRISKVYSVEYVKAFCDAIKSKNIFNIEVINSSCEAFTSDVKADVVFLSGIIAYLTEDIADKLIKNIASYIKPGGYVFLREPISLLDDDYSVDKFSDEIGADYQAYYRTADHIIESFENYGFSLIECSPFFEDGSPLNNREETRRYGFLFQKI